MKKAGLLNHYSPLYSHGVPRTLRTMALIPRRVPKLRKGDSAEGEFLKTGNTYFTL
jgi:hypothetical protein